METLIQATLDGLCVGAIYGLGAMGLVVIQKSSSIFNMSQGMFMMAGAYIAAMFAIPLGMPMWVAALAAMVITAVIGLVINFTVFRKLLGESVFTQLMATIGLMSILYGAILGIWGTVPMIYNTDVLPTGDLIFGQFKISSAYMNGLIIASLACLVLTLYYQYSKEGTAMRATAEDEELAGSVGIRVTKVLRLAWIIGAACAALSGVLFAMLGSVNYMLGEVGMISIIPVMVFGGLESFVGALLAGLIVGVATMIAGAYLEVSMPGIMGVVPLVIMLVVLVIRPYGLFGEERIERI